MTCVWKDPYVNMSQKPQKAEKIQMLASMAQQA